MAGLFFGLSISRLPGCNIGIFPLAHLVGPSMRSGPFTGITLSGDWPGEKRLTLFWLALAEHRGALEWVVSSLSSTASGIFDVAAEYISSHPKARSEYPVEWPWPIRCRRRFSPCLAGEPGRAWHLVPFLLFTMAPVCPIISRVKSPVGVTRGVRKGVTTKG